MNTGNLCFQMIKKMLSMEILENTALNLVYNFFDYKNTILRKKL